jgi:flagellar biosynthesis/type III secretory pathway chaperone
LEAEKFSSARLIKLLRQQRDLYHSLHELSQRQRTLVCGDQPELLLRVLSERRRLVTRLAQINEQLAPCRQDWAGVYQGLSPECQQTAAGLLEEINRTLQSILRADQEDGALLSARKDSMAANLSGLGGGQAVNTAYGACAAEAGSADLSG